MLNEASMAPARVPVTSLVDRLEAGAQATVAVQLISLGSMPCVSAGGDLASTLGTGLDCATLAPVKK